MILSKPIALFIFTIAFMQLFGCAEENILNKKTLGDVEYLNSDAHKKNDAPYSQAVRVGDMLYLSGVIGRKQGYLKKVSNACCVVPTVNKYSITPHTETYQVFVWHMLVSHPKLQIKKTVW